MDHVIPWRVQLTVGSLVVEGSSTDDEDTPLPLVSHATWTDALEDGWGARQAVSTGTITLAMATAEDAAVIQRGAPVVVDVFTGAPEVLAARFAGRCSDPEITPHDLGVVVSLGLVDYLPDLGGYTVDGALPEGSTFSRIFELASDAGLPSPYNAPGYPAPPSWRDPFDYFVHSDYGWHKAEAATVRPYLQALQEFLETAPFGLDGWDAMDNPYPVETSFAEVRPNLLANGTLHATHPWRLEYIPRVVPAVNGGVLPAEWVRFGATWSRPEATYNTVVVTAANGSIYTAHHRQAGEAPVTRRIDSSLDGAHPTGVAELAGAALPPRAAVTDWQADSFTVWLDALDRPGYMPMLRESLAVYGIPPHHHPNDRDGWTGVVGSRKLTMAEGRIDVELTLRRLGVDWTLATPPGGTPTVVQRIRNGSFETGTHLWQAGDNLTLDRVIDTVPGVLGSYVGRVTASGGNGGGASGLVLSSPRGTAGIAATPGQLVHATGRIRRNTSGAPADARLLLQAFNSSGGFISSFATATVSTLAGSPSTLNTVNVSGTAPAGTAYVCAAWYRASGDVSSWTTGGWHIDAVGLVIGTPTQPGYFDGDSTSEYPTSYRWSGTAHNSQAIRTDWEG